MNKEDYIWAAIRIFGIYLLVLAITTIPDVISSIYIFNSPLADSSNLSMMQELSIAKAGTSISKFFVFSCSAYYFLRHGKAIFKLTSNN